MNSFPAWFWSASLPSLIVAASALGGLRALSFGKDLQQAKTLFESAARDLSSFHASAVASSLAALKALLVEQRYQGRSMRKPCERLHAYLSEMEEAAKGLYRIKRHFILKAALLFFALLALRFNLNLNLNLNLSSGPRAPDWSLLLAAFAFSASVLLVTRVFRLDWHLAARSALHLEFKLWLSLQILGERCFDPPYRQLWLSSPKEQAWLSPIEENYRLLGKPADQPLRDQLDAIGRREFAAAKAKERGLSEWLFALEGMAIGLPALLLYLPLFLSSYAGFKD